MTPRILLALFGVACVVMAWVIRWTERRDMKAAIREENAMHRPCRPPPRRP